MTKKKLYRYAGVNGILVTYVLLEGIKHSLKYRLIADPGKILTNGEKEAYIVEIEEEDLHNWWEISKDNNN